MASLIGMAIRSEAAQKRLDERIPLLARRMGLEIPDMPTDRRKPALQEALRLEWMADVLDEVDEAVARLATPVKKTTKGKGK